MKGNITISMLLLVLAIMSGFTITALAVKDTKTFQYQYETVQSSLLLRSEFYRCNAIVNQIGSIVLPMRTNKRQLTVNSSFMKKTLNISSILQPQFLLNSEEQVIRDNAIITKTRSLVTNKTGIIVSPIRKYGQTTISSETFAKFMYFTDKQSSTNETNVYFHGPDMLYGRVHSNSDIWIKRTSGGVNSGWPIFYNWVTTHGRIQSFSGAFQESQVFPGGLTEGYSNIVFPEHATRIQNSGNTVGPLQYSPNNIILIDVLGTTYTGYKGTINEPQQTSNLVYAIYPPPNPQNELFINRYSIRDTTWTILNAGSTLNKSRWVNSKLWIKGTFQSYQTWGCADTMFLIGDILLTNTPKGQNPENNRNDVVGLVSQKSIIVKYGYRTPIDSSRVHTNIGPDGTPPIYGGIWIYAAMAALGNGHGNSHKDGVFTFQYQHPHPSVPNYTINGIVYRHIDLYRRKFPQTSAQPWPPLIDYPWYNPLWPERAPYLQRGYINIYGSVSQRRRGYVHRSYYDTEYESHGIWNQQIDFCGGSSSPQAVSHIDPVLNIPLTTQNFLGATGSGVGYKKNYYYDNRFYKTSPIDFPEITRDGSPNRIVTWVIMPPKKL